MRLQATSAVRSAPITAQFTPFIGRQKEQAEIQQRLADPACRLLTLIGPGGTGKTRLALQIAALHQSQFADGVFFVDLQPVESVEFLIPAIASTLELPLSGQDDPWRQIQSFLESKEVLLALDNFEQVLEGAGLIADLIQQTNRLKILVTSREALNLLGEYLYPVGGMTYPVSAEEKASEQYSAVALFATCARRIRPDFDLENELGHVYRICRLVEGLPLALELAATWLRLMNCAQIAAEIESNINFLAINLRNVPERHRSIQVVFENSWKLLNDEERRVFQRLSVFRSGFGRESAELVTGASLAVLSALVDKSLLRIGGDQQEAAGQSGERYSIHELLRQIAEERLAAAPEEVEEIRNRHCGYYANSMDQYMDRYRNGDQEQALNAIEAEYENVRAAWLWAIQKNRIEDLRKTTPMLEWFFQTNSRYLEGQTTLELAESALKALPSAPDVDYALSQIQASLAWLCVRLGRLIEARERAENSNRLYTKLQAAPPYGIGAEPLTILAVLDQIQGDYEKAVELASQTRLLSINRQDTPDEAMAGYILAGAFLAQGKHELALQYAKEAYQIAKTNNQHWFMAYCLIEWGNVARAMKNYAEASQLYEASYTIRESFNDPEGMAVALSHLGQAALLQADYQVARQQFQQSLQIYQKISDQGGLAVVLNGLALVALNMQEYSRSRRQTQEALQIAVQIQFVPQILSILTTAAELAFLTGHARHGGELLAFTGWHPKTGYETRQRIDGLLSRYAKNLPHTRAEAPVQSSGDFGLNKMVELAMKNLTVSPPPPPLDSPQEKLTGKPPEPGQQALVEPLSEREIEVLGCIAAGLTNQQIAEKLHLSLGTVKWYTSQIYGKLDVNNRAQAIARGRELRLLA